MIFLRVLFILALRSSVIFLTVTFFHSFSFLSLRKESVAWVGDESALLVLCCLTHPLRGWGYVNESKGSKVPDRPVVYATHRKLLRLPGECFVLCFGLPVISLFSLVVATILLCVYVVVLFLYRLVLYCLPHPPHGGARHLFVSFGLFFFFFSFVFSLFDRMCMSSLSYPVR